MAEVVPGPHREGERLLKCATDEGGDLEFVLPVVQLAVARLADGDVVVVDVEARELDLRDAIVVDLVRLFCLLF